MHTHPGTAPPAKPPHLAPTLHSAIKIAKAAGQAVLLQFALREVEQAFPKGRGATLAAIANGAKRASSKEGGDDTKADDGSDKAQQPPQGHQLLVSTMPWVTGLAKTAAALHAACK